MDEIKPQYLRVGEQEVLLREGGNWLHFANPYCIFIAERLEEVLPKLHEVEYLVQHNHWYAAGFLSYESAPAFDPVLQTQASTGCPYLWFGLYPKPRPVALPAASQPSETLNWQPMIDRTAYDSAIERIKDHIASGHTYQVNYTVRLQTGFTGDAWHFFLRFVQHQNEHAAYVDTGQYVICSASPELFFRLDRENITCRPMKGTMKRGRTTLEDQEQLKQLGNSEKNRAENVMIVDMIRNDLGRVAETRTVSVPKLFEVERYPTLWQMTSTVTAKTQASVTEVLAALFPCASITGAPKTSTMKIIAELENKPRNIYTGNIGYMTPGRQAKFNVAIRTALIDRHLQRAEYGIGGGIVWDSVTEEEYAEALLKARILTEQQTPFSLIETMLWTPGEGFFLFDKHIARMLDSADYFDIPMTRKKLEENLAKISSSFQTSQRVRILLDQAGNLDFVSQPIFPEVNSQPLQVCLASQPVDARNIFLFHKTTQRAVYETARESRGEFDDVLFYNTSGELTEFTIGNLVLELDGQWLTPPISCGVLPGTFRAYLTETGQVVERTIPIARLKDCTTLYRVNSIRKWQAVEIRELGRSRR